MKSFALLTVPSNEGPAEHQRSGEGKASNNEGDVFWFDESAFIIGIDEYFVVRLIHVRCTFAPQQRLHLEEDKTKR